MFLTFFTESPEQRAIRQLRKAEQKVCDAQVIAHSLGYNNLMLKCHDTSNAIHHQINSLRRRVQTLGGNNA